ncbi:unnamed protein product [Prorocentrum cordatum]|uniref:Uncharacterized protein n=1 Tax=Prorocentrum cordatum TaxID=2364126 RepID=A0ABN9TYW7_9DINO|nr:unnamed protein product [Polarella glacialis]
MLAVLALPALLLPLPAAGGRAPAAGLARRGAASPGRRRSDVCTFALGEGHRGAVLEEALHGAVPGGVDARAPPVLGGPHGSRGGGACTHPLLPGPGPSGSQQPRMRRALLAILGRRAEEARTKPSDAREKWTSERRQAWDRPRPIFWAPARGAESCRGCGGRLPAMSALRSLLYDRGAGSLRVLDQLRLPTEKVYIDVKTSEDAWRVIREMNIRGAPLIAIVAALGIAVDAGRQSFATDDEADSRKAACTFLSKTWSICAPRVLQP